MSSLSEPTESLPASSRAETAGSIIISPDQSGSAARRFALADAMIVIAMLAVLCAWFGGGVFFQRIAGYLSRLPRVISYLYLDGSPPSDLRGVPARGIHEYLWTTPVTILRELVPPLLFFGTPAVVAFRLRKPRSAWFHILRQPGASACLVVIGMVILEIDLRRLGLIIPTSPVLNIGVAVAVCWTLLLALRVWRNEPSWIDRLGRTIGLGWIGLALFELIERG